MNHITDFPRVVFVLSFLLLWSSVWGAVFVRRGKKELPEDERKDYDLIVGATLTLLGLLIGFSFSMAISRYDQRKNYEEAEANAIGTEYLRADLLPAADAARVRALLKSYLDQRISFYETRNQRELQQIDATTSRLEADLWSAVSAPGLANPNPMSALVVSGMNDVLNSQGYTQAAWWNRIPNAAWTLMIAIAICSHLLIGYGAHRAGARSILFLALPLVVSISFFLVADIDSPRGGVIRVHAQNLVSLAKSWKAQ